MVWFQTPGLLDQIGIGGIKNSLPSTTGVLWSVVILFAVVIVALPIGLLIYQTMKKKKYVLDCLVIENHSDVPYIRNRDLGRILPTPEGPIFEFWRERPLVPPAPPLPEHIAPAEPVPMELMTWGAANMAEAAKAFLGDAPVVGKPSKSWWFPKRRFFDPAKGVQVKIDQRIQKTLEKRLQYFIVNGRKNKPLVIFHYREGIYTPMSWDLKNIDYPALKILKPTDVRFFLDMAQKLVKRHLMRETWMSKYGPILAFMGVAAILLIGLVFLYLQNKDIQSTNQAAIALSKDLVDVARQVGTPQPIGGA